MNVFKMFILRLMGRVPLDEAMRFKRGACLLHISDSPSHFYPELKRMIEVLKPDYIVHTGDLVDNVKLGLRRSLVQRYERELMMLLKTLNQSEVKRVLITLGNHDDLGIIEKYAGRIEVYEEGGQSNFDGVEVAFTHYAADIKRRFGYEDAKFCLYGHDMSLRSQHIENQVYLNGIEAMHLIDLDTGAYISIEYPMGTDSARSNRHRLGI